MEIGILSFIIVIVSLTVHEYAHAAAAFRLGDPTARDLGRMTLNPIAHIDLIGTIILPLFMALTGLAAFGWAKPVPINLQNVQNVRRDHGIISAAGPFANLLMAIAAALMIRIINSTVHGFFNTSQGQFVLLILGLMIFINSLLMLFNLLPLPPLDGAAVLAYFLSSQAAFKLHQIQRYGFIILLVLIWTNILYVFYLRPVMTVMNYGFNFIAGVNIEQVLRVFF